MNLSHLRYVLEVQKTSSITKAAHNLYMGQPNLSKAIKELENEIGITIFKRTAKGVLPTHAGEEFLHKAAEILQQVNELQDFYRPSHEGSALHYAFSVPRATYIAAQSAQWIEQQMNQPQIHVHFKETGSLQVVSDVAEGEFDWGVVRYQMTDADYFESLFEEKGLKSEVIDTFDMVLMMSCRHPLANCKEISYDQLENCPEIIHGDFFEPPAHKTHPIQRHAKQIYVYDRASQYDVMHYVADSYMWVSPTKQELLDPYDLVTVACRGDALRTKDVLIYLKTKANCSVRTAFMDMLRQKAPGFLARQK